ncbi:unnamed protein product, partial [marine sediment metagenome]
MSEKCGNCKRYVEAAFEEYSEGFTRDYLEIVCAVDFGLGHETTMGNLAYRKEQIYELDSWGKFNPTSDMILAKVEEYAAKYSPLFIMEGSPLGVLRASHAIYPCVRVDSIASLNNLLYRL